MFSSNSSLLVCVYACIYAIALIVLCDTLYISAEGKGYPLQYSGLENSMDCIVHGIAKSQTGLSDFHFTSQDAFSSIE